MIISRTPLRMSFVGGGSDISSYYSHSGGSVISTTLDQYVYINVNKSFSNQVRVAYSKVEEVDSFTDVEHPLIREVAKHLDFQNGLEITSIADIPSKGTGLGSSSTFTVGLINALASYKGLTLSKTEIAEIACQIEIDICNQPIGKQDQYAAACGGFNIFNFNPDGSVDVIPLIIGENELHQLKSWMMIFYTGITRSASSILEEQTKNSKDSTVRLMLDEMVSLVDPFAEALMKGNLESAGFLLNENWNLKKHLAAGVSNPSIDELYKCALQNGALGGKLLGAGTGGFMLFLVPPMYQQKVASALAPLRQMYWGFDKFGTRLIMQS